MEELRAYNPPLHFSEEEQLIWQLLIYRDFQAFCSCSWRLIEDDFIKDGFFGIDGKGSENKDDWSLSYPSLESYKKAWISQSKEFTGKAFKNDPLKILFEKTKLSKIEILGDLALVHKHFDARFDLKDENPIVLDWISLFVLQKIGAEWKIRSFTGYLPK